MSRFFALAALAAFTSCTTASVTTPAAPALELGAGEDWDNPGGDWAESHFSRLESITPALSLIHI